MAHALDLSQNFWKLPADVISRGNILCLRECDIQRFHTSWVLIGKIKWHEVLQAIKLNIVFYRFFYRFTDVFFCFKFNSLK